MAIVSCFVPLPKHLYQHTLNAYFTSGARLVGRSALQALPKYTSYHVEDFVCQWLNKHLHHSDWQLVCKDPEDDPTVARETLGFQFANRDHALMFKLTCL